jgi:peptidoglycan/LPS O-acetylase OafA/YrhL
VHEWLAVNNFLAHLHPFSDLLRSTGQIGSPNSVSWSISAEFLAYLCFPFIVILTRRLGPWPLLVMMPLIGSALIEAGLLPRDNLIRVLYCFSLGVSLFHVRPAVSAYAHRFMPVPRQFWALTAAAVVVGLFTFFRSADGGAPYLVALLATAALIACVCNARDWFDRALARRTMVYLGEISYAFYMIHWFVIKVCERAFQNHIQDGSSWLYMIMGCELFISGVMAAALFKYIENPARQAIQRAYVRQHRL